MGLVHDDEGGCGSCLLSLDPVNLSVKYIPVKHPPPNRLTMTTKHAATATVNITTTNASAEEWYCIELLVLGGNTLRAAIIVPIPHDPVPIMIQTSAQRYHSTRSTKSVFLC